MRNFDIVPEGFKYDSSSHVLQVNEVTKYLLFEFIDTPIIITDFNLKINSYNKSAKKKFSNLSEEDFQNDFKSAVLLHDKTIASLEIINSVKNTGLWKGQIAHEHSGKKECILSVFAIKVLLDNKRCILFIIGKSYTEQDICNILKPFQIFSSLADNLPFGIFLYETKSKTNIFLNNYLQSQLKYQRYPVEKLNELFNKNCDPDDLKTFSDDLKQLEKSKNHDVVYCKTNMRSNVDTIEIFNNYCTIFKRDAKGSVTHIIGFFNNVSQANSIVNLELVVQTYNSLFNSIADTIFIIDYSSKIIDINEAAIDFVGSAKENIIGKTITDISKSNSVEFNDEIVKVVSKSIVEFDLQFQKKNGKTILKHLSLIKGNYFGSNVIFVLTREVSAKNISEPLIKENQDAFRSLIASHQDAVVLFKDRKLILVNQAWFKMFGYTEKEVYNNDFDIIQTVAPSSRPMIFKELEKSIKKNYSETHLEIQGITKSNKIIQAEVSFTTAKWGGETIQQGIFRDISKKNHDNQFTNDKDVLLDHTAKATHLLLTQSNLGFAVNSSFEIIGNILGLSRVYIFENSANGSYNEHFMRIKFEWTNGKVSKKIDNQLFHELNYKKFPGWYSLLSSGSFINSLVNDCPDSAKEILAHEKVLSILIVPIIVNQKLWGFIGFDDCQSERVWTNTEKSILITLGNTFGNAFVRKVSEHALIESEERYRSLFDQSADLLAFLNTNNTIVNINRKIEFETGWRREDILGKNIFDVVLLSANSKALVKNQLADKNSEAIIEVELTKKDGNLIPFELKMIPIVKDGKIINTQMVFRNIKERKENERYLKESEEKYRNIFENVQDIFFQTDLHGKIITISPSIERYSGYLPEELIGKRVISFYATPRDRAKLLKEMQEKNEVSDFGVRLRHKEGKIVYVSVNSHMLRNKYGEIIGVEGSLRDITERELAYDEIRKLSRAVEQSPSTVSITDTTGKIVYVNPKFTESTGYLSAEVIGKNSSILKSGEMSIEQYKELWDTISLGKEWKGEFHNKKKNGELFWESASITPIKNENGEITHYLAIKEDITEKKYQERRLIKYQNLLKGVSESVQILISEKNFDHAIENALKALGIGSGADRVYVFESSIGMYKKEPMMDLKYFWNGEKSLGAIDSEFINNLSTGKSYSQFQHSINNNKSFSVVAKNLSESDQAILDQYGTLSLLIVPIYVDKQFWGFIGFDNCRVYEPWSESEESILIAAAATIGRAIEREKTNKELIRAKEEAEKAERLKSEFLAQISHEIRSPLNVLLNYSQLFRDVVGDKIDPEVFQGFDGMENAGNRIIRTIDMLLNISEIQTGSYSFRPKSMDIYSEVIFPLFQEYKKLARSKNIIFNVIRHTDNTKITGDEYSVVQIFANLIDNAIKYTNEGKIEVFIDRNFNNKLFVKVSDSGIGISESYLPLMYSPFSQEEQGYTRSYEGNGLGLALVKKYCELNNADIFVDSIKGKGTTFTIVCNS